MRKWFIIIFVFFCVLLSSLCIYGETDQNRWIGQKILFLPQTKNLQKYGYQTYSFNKNDLYSGIPYEGLAGKIATINKIYKKGITTIGEFVLEDGSTVFGNSLGIPFQQIAFLSEMEDTKQYIGKTFWNISKTFAENYDEEKGEFLKVPLKNLEPLKLIEIKWWYAETHPLWFVFKNSSGNVIHWFGYYKNVTWEIPSSQSVFERWYLKDPKTLHPEWSPKVWFQIENFKVSIGMTSEMVLMSWGKPEKKNKTITANTSSEQWVYPDNQYIYFENDIVTSIQTSE